MAINVQEYRKRVLSKILPRLSLTGQEIAADIGCGEGEDCLLLVKNVKETVGMDVEYHANWLRVKNSKIDFSVADAENIPFLTEYFDMVIEKDVLHHVRSPLEALQELLRITKSGGHVVCIEGNRYNPIFYFHMTLLQGHNHFTKRFFEDLIKNASTKTDLFSIESRVYPTKNVTLLRLLHRFENFVERIGPLRGFLCYNIAIIKK